MIQLENPPPYNSFFTSVSHIEAIQTLGGTYTVVRKEHPPCEMSGFRIIHPSQLQEAIGTTSVVLEPRGSANPFAAQLKQVTLLPLEVPSSGVYASAGTTTYPYMEERYFRLSSTDGVLSVWTVCHGVETLVEALDMARGSTSETMLFEGNICRVEFFFTGGVITRWFFSQLILGADGSWLGRVRDEYEKELSMCSPNSTICE
jgi:hypothetical protein